MKKLKPFIIVFIILFVFAGLLGKVFISRKPLFIFNYAPFIITTSSMEPQYLAHSLIIIKKEKMSNLKPGDVIAYKSDALHGKLAFHRVTKVTDVGFFTKGDKNNYEDKQLIGKDKYIGKGVLHFNGIANYFSVVKTLHGFVLYLFMPVLLVIVFYITVRKLMQIRRN